MQIRSSAAVASQDKKHQGSMKGWAAEACIHFSSQVAETPGPLFAVH